MKRNMVILRLKTMSLEKKKSNNESFFMTKLSKYNYYFDYPG